MTTANKPDTIHTRIWQEEAEQDNPFAARVARCRGYDVYGEMLGHARWVELLWLLFREQRPSQAQADALEALAIALANPGPRDPAVHAAMCGGVGGSTSAASLMAALAPGAGQYGGGREVFLAMQGWAECGLTPDRWQDWFDRIVAADAADAAGSIWPAPEHPPGFDPHGVSTALPVRQTLDELAAFETGPRLRWLHGHRQELETIAGKPLALSGVAAAAFADLGFAPEQGEMLHLLLRLPGAAAHALEQQAYGHKRFPFGRIELETGALGMKERETGEVS